MRRISALVVALTCAAGIPLVAQQSPFVGDQLYRVLVNEISGDIAFEHVRWFTHYHRPTGGSEGFEAVARYVEQKARDYGLEDVRALRMAAREQSWTAKLGELWLTDPVERRLAFSPEVALSLADFSRSTDIKSAELVDVGDGAAEKDYAGKDVAGKVVLTSGSLYVVMSEAVWKRGALGVVAISTSRARDYPDQLSWMRIPTENRDGTKQGTFAFVLSSREGQRLRREMATAKDQAFKVRARVESTFTTPSFQTMVEAVIRGSEIHNQDIVLTGHLQEERFSANDDASGCASVLEIARALKKSIDEGRLPRPRRDIRFWWVDEISGEEQYFADHPEERRQMLANVNQDMVGAKQSAGSRVQFVTRPPSSRASFLGDVVESIVESLVRGNTGYLAAGMAAQPDDWVWTSPDSRFTRPILSRLGTRERYDARVIPFHNSTDSQVFNSGIIGVPAVTFTNWPDDFIHSSDDDLWQVDPTQLKRNAVAVGAIAWYLASAGDADVPRLATDIYGSALERMSRDLHTAMEMVERAGQAERAVTYARAANLVREAARRERRALETVRVFARKGGPGDLALNGIVAQLPTDEAAESRLAAYYSVLTGEKLPPSAPSTEERNLDGKVPVLTDSVKEFLALEQQVESPRSLHPLMSYEAINFANGKNSLLDIYRAVAAEADSAGDWYYGTVSPADIAGLFESAEKAGLVRMKQSPRR
jgi:hypothetical protein